MADKNIIHDNNSTMRYRYDVIDRRFLELEKQRGLTMKEWARIANLTGPTVKAVRLGKNVSVDTLKSAALAIDINPEFLLKKKFQFRRAVLNGMARR